jgi:hypothetical protein
MQIMEGDCIRSIRKAIKWVGHFHTAGNPGRKISMTSRDELYRHRSRHRRDRLRLVRRPRVHPQGRLDRGSAPGLCYLRK